VLRYYQSRLKVPWAYDHVGDTVSGATSLLFKQKTSRQRVHVFPLQQDILGLEIEMENVVIVEECETPASIGKNRKNLIETKQVDRFGFSRAAGLRFPTSSEEPNTAFAVEFGLTFATSV
jgi:hypothetical protein